MVYYVKEHTTHTYTPFLQIAPKAIAIYITVSCMSFKIQVKLNDMKWGS